MARSPDRIDPVLDKIRQVWYDNPDLRLTQLIENVADQRIEHCACGMHDWHHNCCMYYMEDNELVERLEKQYG